MKKISTFMVAMLLSSSAYADSKLGIYGGVSGDFKSPNVALKYSTSPKSHEHGFIINIETNFDFLNNDYYSFIDNTDGDVEHDFHAQLGGKFGYQIGTPMGGWQILPLGLSVNADSYRYIKDNKKKDLHHANLMYSFGVGYKLNIDEKMTFNARVDYNIAVASYELNAEALKDANNICNGGNVSSNIVSEILNESYKPKGMSFEADFDYKFTNYFSLGFQIKATDMQEYQKNTQFRFGANYIW